MRRKPSKRTVVQVEASLVALAAWLVSQGEAPPGADAWAAASPHLAKHVDLNATPCFEAPCKAAAACVAIYEILFYGQRDDLVEDALAVADALDAAARLLEQAEDGVRAALAPLRAAVHAQFTGKGLDLSTGGRFIIRLPQLLADAERGAGWMAQVVAPEREAARELASAFREHARWADDDSLPQRADRLVLSVTQHLDDAGFSPREIADLVLDDGERETRPHVSGGQKQRSPAIDRVGQRLRQAKTRSYRIAQVPVRRHDTA